MAKAMLNILGTDYTMEIKNYKDDSEFEKAGIDGYCDSVTKEIVVCNMSTFPGLENETKERNKLMENYTMRHEIMHAFLNESGLQESSYTCKRGWAKNEEMIDWFAIQSPKIFKVYQELGIL